jgi:mono/diheme cytochrome c family protein
MLTLSLIGKGAILSATLFLAVPLIVAQEGQTLIIAPPETTIGSGEAMYRTYCAVCHGTDGKGGGPATPALRDQVPDLTTLTQTHGGKFPAQYVASVLRFGTGKGLEAHGNREMPIWGPIFKSMPRSNSSTVTLKITNLTQYIGTLQTK